ncbi:hypothetical protein D3C72_960140 [compost metagenome]
MQPILDLALHQLQARQRGVGNAIAQRDLLVRHLADQQRLRLAPTAEQLLLHGAAESRVEGQLVGRVGQHLRIGVRLTHLPPLGRQPKLSFLVGAKTLRVRACNIGQAELIVPIGPHLDGGSRGQQRARTEQDAALIGRLTALDIGDTQAELAAVAAPEPLLHPEQGDLQLIPTQGMPGRGHPDVPAQALTGRQFQGTAGGGGLRPEVAQLLGFARHGHCGIINGDGQREGRAACTHALITRQRRQAVVAHLELRQIAADLLGVHAAHLLDTAAEIPVILVPGRHMGGEGRPERQLQGEAVDPGLLAVEVW